MEAHILSGRSTKGRQATQRILVHHLQGKPSTQATTRLKITRHGRKLYDIFQRIAGSNGDGEKYSPRMIEQAEDTQLDRRQDIFLKG